MKHWLLIGLIIPLGLSAQIHFESSWEEAQRQSVISNKPIFLYAYTTWCDPCEEMEEYVFSDLEVANVYNANFVNVALDMEDYPGLELVEQYAVAFFPSYLFMDAEGRVLHRGCGAMDSNQFLAMAQEANSSDQSLRSFEMRFQEGERSATFMISYLEKLDEACLDAELFAGNYLKTLKPEVLFSDEAWAVFAGYQWDIYSREFQYLIQNQKRFEDSLGSKEVQGKIYDTFLAQYQEVFAAEDLHEFGMRALLHELKDLSFSGADTLHLMMELHYAEYVENWEDFAQYAIEWVGMTNTDDVEELNELAWKFYLFVNDKNQLEIASSWAKQVVEQVPDPSFIDTYASLQYKLGKRKQAIELEKQALEMAKEMGLDTTHFQYQLEKFQRK